MTKVETAENNRQPITYLMRCAARSLCGRSLRAADTLQLRHELVHAGALDRVEFGSLTRASKQPNCIPMPRTDACTICQGGDDEGLVLHCDGTCNCAFHAHCVGFRGPVMGDWMCGMCDEATATTCASHE